MPKTGLEKAIEDAVADFTDFVMVAVRDMPLDELSALRGEDLIVRPEPEPEPAPKPMQKGRAKPKPKPKPKPKVHPKCAFPGCDRNRFVRGHGYCGKHWRWWKKGKIEGGPVKGETP